MWPLSDKRIAEREFGRIVIRVPNWMGDQIMATPALDAVRKRYPQAHITGFGTGVAQRIYGGGTWYDDFLVCGRRESLIGQARRLRQGRYDACLLLTGSFRTALPPFLARIPHRIGYRRSGRTPLLTAHWPRPRPEGKKAPYPTKLYYRDLVAKLGAKAEGRVRLALSGEARAGCEAWLAEHGIADSESILAMCVGAAFGPSKLWPAEYFAAVADRMAEAHGARVVVLCGPGEEDVGAAVRGHARRALIDTGLDPLPLDVLKALIARSRVLLTNDTGPRHIAASFDVPVVCVMGPTDPTYTDTDMENQEVLRADGVECSPCHLKTCPVPGHPCMTKVTADRAVEAVVRAWG